MELLLMLVTGSLMLAAIEKSVSCSGSVEGLANNMRKKADVSGGRGRALSLDEAYRGGAGASLGRSYIGLEGINNDPIK